MTRLRSLAHVAVYLLVTVLCACGLNAVDSARVALTATERTITASTASLLEFDKVEQAKIVAAATSEEDGKARLESYRAKRVEVVKSIIATQSLVSAGWTLLALIDQGVKSVADLTPMLGPLLDAGVKLTAAIQAFTGGK